MARIRGQFIARSYKGCHDASRNVPDPGTLSLCFQQHKFL
jgi:hypothetical protein